MFFLYETSTQNTFKCIFLKVYVIRNVWYSHTSQMLSYSYNKCIPHTHIYIHLYQIYQHINLGFIRKKKFKNYCRLRFVKSTSSTHLYAHCYQIILITCCILSIFHTCHVLHDLVHSSSIQMFSLILWCSVELNCLLLFCFC